MLITLTHINILLSSLSLPPKSLYNPENNKYIRIYDKKLSDKVLEE